jgi:hypothetical protein
MPSPREINPLSGTQEQLALTGDRWVVSQLNGLIRGLKKRNRYVAVVLLEQAIEELEKGSE